MPDARLYVGVVSRETCLHARRLGSARRIQTVSLGYELKFWIRWGWGERSFFALSTARMIPARIIIQNGKVKTQHAS